MYEKKEYEKKELSQQEFFSDVECHPS